MPRKLKNQPSLSVKPNPVGNVMQNLMQKSVQLGGAIDSLQHKGLHLNNSRVERSWQPAFDISRVDPYLYIDVELPGVPPTLVEVVSHQDQLLEVRGRKPLPTATGERDELVSQLVFGAFSCQFALPDGMWLANLDQRLENGVLHLRVEMRAATPNLSNQTATHG